MLEGSPEHVGRQNARGRLWHPRRLSYTGTSSTETLSARNGKPDSRIPCKGNCSVASLALTITGTTTNTHSVGIQITRLPDCFSNRHVTRLGISSSQCF